MHQHYANTFSTFDLILGAIGLAITVALGLLAAPDVLGFLLADLGNPLARWLGLQAKYDPTGGVGGKQAQVVQVAPAGLRVTLDGTSWPARSEDKSWSPEIDECVIVTKRDGLTLLVMPLKEEDL